MIDSAMPRSRRGRAWRVGMATEPSCRTCHDHASAPFASSWFPRVVAAAPHLGAAIQKPESHHQHGGATVRELQHLLLKWFLGPHRLGA